MLRQATKCKIHFYTSKIRDSRLQFLSAFFENRFNFSIILVIHSNLWLEVGA